MTTTLIISPDQDLQGQSPTALTPNHLNDNQTLETKVPASGTTWSPTQIDQPGPDASTSSVSIDQARLIGPARITGLDRWEGKVLEVDGQVFTAELYPIEREGMPITGDFAVELLGSDAAAIVPGDVFYLSVRTVKQPGMRPARTENLRLRRLGRITPEEVQQAYAKADALMERLEHLFD